MERPVGVRALRRLGRRVILGLLCLAPVAQAGLAMRAGMGWELVALLGAGLAGVAVLGRVRAPAGLALLLAASAVLVQGAGHGVMPGWALAVGVVVVAGLLMDLPALGLALGAMVVAALAGDGGMAGGMAPGLAAGMTMAAQGAVQGAVRRMTVPAVVLRPCARRATLRPMAAPAPAPDFLVQAERGPEGALRLAVAGRTRGRLRVSVC